MTSDMEKSTGNKPRNYNIAIDLQPLYSWHSTRGIGRYVFNIINAVIRTDRENNYYLINFYGEVPAELKVSGENVTGIDLYDDTKTWLYKEPSEERRAVYESYIHSIIEQYSIDIFLIGAVVDPFFIYEKQDFRNVRFMSIAHDVIPLIYGKTYLKDMQPAKTYWKWFEQYLYSDYIFTNSETTKKDLVNMLDVQEHRILSVYAGVASSFQKINYPKEDKLRTLKKYGITNEYVFCVGADDSRKNLDRLVRAFLSMPEMLLKKYQLVVTCSLSETTIQRLRRYEGNYDGMDRIVFTNYISDDDMICLLNCAKLAAFPSTYEGFGLPIVEAWKCGVPVLTSDNSSLGEIAEDAAITVDPFSDDSVRNGLVYALTEADLDELIKKGTEMCKKYTWENAARLLTGSYASVMKLEKIDIDSLEYQKKVKDLKKLCFKHVKLGSRLRNIKKPSGSF